MIKENLIKILHTVYYILSPERISIFFNSGGNNYGNVFRIYGTLLRTYAESARPPAVLLSCSADVPAATAAAALPDPPRLTAYRPSTPAAQRSRRVTLPRRESSRDYSEIPRLQSSSSAATTSAQAAFPLPSANLRTVWRST